MMTEETPINSNDQIIKDVNNPTDRRDKMWEQSARLLALINGGAVVALLAFVQAIWKDAPELIIWVAVSLIVFSLGLALAAAIPQLRELTVLNYISNKRLALKHQKRYKCSARVSVVLFVFGVIIVATGLLKNLPEHATVGKKVVTEEVQPQSNN